MQASLQSVWLTKRADSLTRPLAKATSMPWTACCTGWSTTTSSSERRHVGSSGRDGIHAQNTACWPLSSHGHLVDKSRSILHVAASLRSLAQLLPHSYPLADIFLAPSRGIPGFCWRHHDSVVRLHGRPTGPMYFPKLVRRRRLFGMERPFFAITLHALALSREVSRCCR